MASIKRYGKRLIYDANLFTILIQIDLFPTLIRRASMNLHTFPHAFSKVARQIDLFSFRFEIFHLLKNYFPLMKSEQMQSTF